MSPEEMRHLYEYNAWANRRSLTAAVALTSGAIHQADGLELFFRARHAGAHLRRRMDLAGTFPGPLTILAPGYQAIP